jgi:hypothetical protein
LTVKRGVADGVHHPHRQEGVVGLAVIIGDPYTAAELVVAVWCLYRIVIGSTRIRIENKETSRKIKFQEN